MTYDRPPAYIPATPEYILAMIRDSHRQQCRFDSEADADVELDFETTIAQWRDACDLLDWRLLGRALDDEWQLGRPDAAWRAILQPARKRTLRELCEFIAQGASRPSIEPMNILGTMCFPAGAFLAIRSLLRDAGADVESVTPSTSLDEYTRHHLGVFLGPISKLAPNALPGVTLSMPGYDLSIAVSLVGVVATVVGWFSSPLVTIAGFILALTGWGVSWVTSADRRPPSHVAFGSLQTFRDLARTVADGAQNATPQG